MGRKNHALPYVKCLLCTYSLPFLPALLFRAVRQKLGDGMATGCRRGGGCVQINPLYVFKTSTVHQLHCVGDFVESVPLRFLQADRVIDRIQLHVTLSPFASYPLQVLLLRDNLPIPIPYPTMLNSLSIPWSVASFPLINRNTSPAGSIADVMQVLTDFTHACLDICLHISVLTSTV